MESLNIFKLLGDESTRSRVNASSKTEGILVLLRHCFLSLLPAGAGGGGMEIFRDGEIKDRAGRRRTEKRVQGQADL